MRDLSPVNVLRKKSDEGKVRNWSEHPDLTLLGDSHDPIADKYCLHGLNAIGEEGSYDKYAHWSRRGAVGSFDAAACLAEGKVLRSSRFDDGE